MRRGIGFIAILAFLGFVAFGYEQAYAIPPDPTSMPLPVTCSNYVGLTNHIVGCVRDTLDSATTRFFNGVYPLVSRALTAVFIIAVALFGAMAAFGMLEKVGRDAIMLLLKIAMVSYFVTSTDDLYRFTTLMMDSSAEAVVGYIPISGKSDNTPNSDFSQITCMKNMQALQQGTGRNVHIKTFDELGGTAATYNTGSVSGPWMAMDCMIDSVIGIKVANKNPINSPGTVSAGFNDVLSNKDSGLSRGLLYLFFSSFQSSIMGLILAIIGFIFLWGIINLIIKALFIYLAGYLGIATLMILGPLFIPLVLFQSTRSYFDKWIKLLISFALQPVIILVFVSFSIAAVDLATFSGKYSVMYRIAGEASHQPGFSLNTYLTCPRLPGNAAVCQSTTATPAGTQTIISKKPLVLARVKTSSTDAIPLLEANTESLVKNLDSSKCQDALMNADPDLKKACEHSYPLQVIRDGINWQLMADARTPAVTLPNPNPDKVTAEQQISREALAAVIFAAIVVFVMNQLLRVIPMVAYDLIGDFGQLPNLGSAVGTIPGSQGVRQELQSMVTGRKSPS